MCCGGIPGMLKEWEKKMEKNIPKLGEIWRHDHGVHPLVTVIMISEELDVLTVDLGGNCWQDYSISDFVRNFTRVVEKQSIPDPSKHLCEPGSTKLMGKDREFHTICKHCGEELD